MNDLIQLTKMESSIFNERKEIISTSTFLEIIDEKDEIKLNELLKIHNTESWTFLNDLNNAFQMGGWFPWLIILFEKEYRIAGYLTDLYVISNGHNWEKIWIQPSIFSFVILILFIFTFRNEKIETKNL